MSDFDQFMNSQLGRQFFADVAGIRKALEKLVQEPDPHIEVVPNPEYVTRQYFNSTQVANMLEGAGFRARGAQPGQDTINALMKRKTNPLPPPEAQGWWAPTFFAWATKEKDRRKQARAAYEERYYGSRTREAKRAAS